MTQPQPYEIINRLLSKLSPFAPWRCQEFVRDPHVPLSTLRSLKNSFLALNQNSRFRKKSNDSCAVYVYLTSRASREKFAGIFLNAERQAYIKAYVSAAPENNKANMGLIRLIADEFGIAPSTITIVSGHHSRRKKLIIHGGGDSLHHHLAQLCNSYSFQGTLF